MALKKKKAASTKRARSTRSEGSRPSSNNNKKMPSEDGGGLFSAVRALDAEDSREEAKRRKRSHRLVEQSRAAQSQDSLYWSLVECRIVLQRSVAGLHKWRREQHQQLPETESERKVGVAEDAADPSSEFVKQCDELLVRLLEGRRILNRKQSGSGEGQEGSDDEERDEDAVDYASIVGTTENRDADDEDPAEPLENVLQTEYDQLREGWKEVLNKRHSDVRLRSGITSKTQFKVVDSSFWQQVEATAEHEHQHHQLRTSAAAARSSSSDDGSRPTFDDSKVYQQLLKDFLSSHHGASSGAAAGAGSEAQERLLRRRREKEQQSSSKKADVDRKASKGRKIRYHDIPKLQHFTFPIARGAGVGGGGSANPAATTLLDEDEWFRSLFGGGAERS